MVGYLEIFTPFLNRQIHGRGVIINILSLYEDNAEEDIEEALREFREQVKQHTLRSMKAEMAPWTKDYTPELGDINTKLMITKQKNRVHSQSKTVKYGQVFSTNKAMVLAKGGHGTGKTLLSKKIAHDWAKGIFTQFYLVFVVFLDLIGSFTSLEDVIAQQYCHNDTQRQSIKHIFENLGKKCLVIIDVGNENMSNIWSKIPWSKFNFLVTLNHLKDKNIEDRFDTICEIQGFTRTESESLVVKDKSRLDAILNCKLQVPVAFSTCTENCNPMLVMFLCFLDDSALDRSIENESLSLCAIFMKLVTLVSKQGFDAFCSEVRSFGGMILQRLQVGKRLVGHFSKAFSLLVQHGSQSSFLHRSIELFLGAFYFMLMLSDGESMESLFGLDCQNPIFFTNSLSLYFCLSLLKDKSPISVSRREAAYKHLKAFVLKHFNSVQLDLMSIAKLHPTLSYSYAYRYKDELVLDFLNDILSECQNARILFLSQDFPGNEILSRMQSSFKNLSMILCVNPMEMINPVVLPDAEADSPELKLVLHNQSTDFIDQMRNALLSSKRQFSLHVLASNVNKPMIEFSTFTQGNVTKLHMQHDMSQSYRCFLQNTHDLPSCQFLTHLSLTSSKLDIDDSVFKALSKAVQEGKLPNLSHLSFARLKEVVKNKLHLLFQTPWSNLLQLDLSDCQLDENDVQIVLGATDPGQQNLFPVLSSLAIDLRHFKNVDRGNLLTQQWTSLTTLDMSYSGSGNFQTSTLTGAVNNGIVPNLTTLKLWDCKLSVAELTLNAIGSNLKLKSFALTGSLQSKRAIDLKLLAKQNFITKLRHLDLSYSCFEGFLFHLLCHRFPLLESLKL